MTHPGQFDPHPVTSAATADSGAEPLPDDLTQEAVGRLRVLTLVIVGLWTMGLIVNHLVAPKLGLDLSQMVPWPPFADLLAAACIALSAFVYWLAPRAVRVPGRLFTVATAYQVTVAFAVGVINQWQPVALAGRLSWLCVLILHLSLRSCPPRRKTVMIGSLLAASMDPVGLLIARARGVELPPPALLVWTYLPNYICAVLAVLPSKIIVHLSRQGEPGAPAGQLPPGRADRSRRHGRGMEGGAPALRAARGDQAHRGARAWRSVSDRVAEERFRREAQVAAGLRSPHTIQLYDFGITRDRRLYYVMELLEGCDLETLVTRYGPQPAARVAYILRQACHSLAEAHAAGLVHRDIKPANLHIGRVGLEYDFVKVLDFGLVKRQAGVPGGDVQLTAPESMSGTPAYLAPEMASGEPVDARADLYALGCVGYFLVTGRRVFEGQHPMQVILQHIRAEPVPPSVRLGRPVPAGLEQLLLRSLAKSPDDRPPDAIAMAETLGAAGADEWIQGEARQWWETTFTPVQPAAPRADRTVELVEVGDAGGTSP